MDGFANHNRLYYLSMYSQYQGDIDDGLHIYFVGSNTGVYKISKKRAATLRFFLGIVKINSIRYELPELKFAEYLCSAPVHVFDDKICLIFSFANVSQSKPHLIQILSKLFHG